MPYLWRERSLEGTTIPRALSFPHESQILWDLSQCIAELPHKQKSHVQIFTPEAVFIPVDHSNCVVVTGLILLEWLHKEHRVMSAQLKV